MTDSLRSDLADDAFREGNLVAVGTAPTAPELTESTALLNRTINSLLGSEIGEKLHGIPQPLPSSFTWNNLDYQPDAANPPVNSRLVMNQTDDFTTTWYARPGDGARMAITAVTGAVDVTIDANGHFIDTGDRSILQEQVTLSLAQGDAYEWFYRADMSMWVLTSTNAAGAFTTLDNSPFPPEFDGLLITATALRLQPRYGNSPLEGTISEYTRMMRIAKARYSQTVPVITSNDVPLSPDTTEMFFGGYRG